MPSLVLLCALGKEDGGVRPIAVGCFPRRLARKLAARHASNLLSSEMAPTQLGVGVKGGCEGAVHALRNYAKNCPHCSNYPQHHS